ncbi:MAG: hypothetical protein R3F14_21935 [Polyangiaceae bacterium]
MRHLWKGITALAVLGAAVLPMASAGCVDAEAMFFVMSVKPPNCSGTISVDDANLSEGRLDARYSCEYYAWLELGNQLVPRGDPNKLQVETSRISVTSVDVQVFAADGTQIQNSGGAAEFNYPTVGFVNPANGTAPGRGLAQALLLDGATVTAVAATGGTKVIARVVVKGRTLGGDDIETRPFDFPIDICVGCLCFEPPGDTCVDPAGEPDTCALSQDFGIDCRWLGTDCSTPATCGQF